MSFLRLFSEYECEFWHLFVCSSLCRRSFSVGRPHLQSQGRPDRRQRSPLGRLEARRPLSLYRTRVSDSRRKNSLHSPMHPFSPQHSPRTYTYLLFPSPVHLFIAQNPPTPDPSTTSPDYISLQESRQQSSLTRIGGGDDVIQFDLCST